MIIRLRNVGYTATGCVEAIRRRLAMALMAVAAQCWILTEVQDLKNA